MIAASGLAKPTVKGAVKGISSNLGGHKFGVEAGYAHSWMYPTTKILVSYGGTNTPYEAAATLNLDGFYIGPSYTYFFNTLNGLYVNGSIIYQYGTCSNLSKDEKFISALTFDLLRTKEETQQILECDKLSYTAHSLDVPIRIGYNYTFKNGLGFQIFVGPVFNFALDWKLTGEKEGVRYDLNQLNGYIYVKNGDNSITWKEGYQDRAVYNVFDVALGGGVGFTYDWFYLNLSCDWGLTNICKTASLAGTIGNEGMYAYTNSARQTNLKLGIGVRF